MPYAFEKGFQSVKALQFTLLKVTFLLQTICHFITVMCVFLGQFLFKQEAQQLVGPGKMLATKTQLKAIAGDIFGSFFSKVQ